jgi:hypothetical protein
MRKLPTFKGYTVDVRLKEFRRILPGNSLEFIPFDSDKGDVLLGKFISTFNLKNPEELQLLSDIWT